MLTNWFGLHINPADRRPFGLTILGLGVVSTAIGFALSRSSKK